MSIGVSIVEDDPELRQALAVLIQGTPGFRSRSQHASAEDALRSLPAAQPAVVLMDIQLPKLTGIQCDAQFKESLPETQFLIGIFTVRSHIRKIYEKLHVHSRTEAVVKYLRQQRLQ